MNAIHILVNTEANVLIGLTVFTVAALPGLEDIFASKVIYYPITNRLLTNIFMFALFSHGAPLCALLYLQFAMGSQQSYDNLMTIDC